MLLDFHDYDLPVPSHTYSQDNFASLFFTSNLGLDEGLGLPDTYSYSVYDYFIEVSGGSINISGDISSVTEWIEMPESYSYYVDQDQGLGGGQGGILQSGKAALVHALSNTDVNMSQFDSDSDGICDAVILIMEGWSSGSKNHFWSFKGSLLPGEASSIDPSATVNQNDELVVDGKIIRNFIVTTEKMFHSDDEFNMYSQGDIRPIGTICHEIGHILGLPDLYDTSDNAAPGIGDWGLMGSGNWNNQTSPSIFCAWSSERLGIVSVVDIDDAYGDLFSIEPVNSSNQIHRINIGQDAACEYLLIENRDDAGLDSYIKGEGMLIWHVDERLISSYPFYNEVNTNPDYYGVRLIEAGGSSHLSESGGVVTSDESHIFSDFSGVLSDYSSPSLSGNSYDRDADGVLEASVLSDIEISNISSSGDVISFILTAPENTSSLMAFAGGVEAVYPNIYKPGVKYSPDRDEYLKIVQPPIMNSFLGMVDSLRLSIYDIYHTSSIGPSNLYYTKEISIDLGDNREFGSIDINTDALELSATGDYFIQIEYIGEGSAIPAEIGFLGDIDVSGDSFWNNSGSLFSAGAIDFSINIITSLSDEYDSDEDFIYIQESYPFPNPSSNTISIYIPPSAENQDVEIFNVLGSRVHSGVYSPSTLPQLITIPLGSYSSGIYFMIRCDEEHECQKNKFTIIH